jgi:hypothetical protein
MTATVDQMILHAIEAYEKQEFMLCMREERYVSLSTEEFAVSVKNFSLGLMELGFETGQRT